MFYGFKYGAVRVMLTQKFMKSKASKATIVNSLITHEHKWIWLLGNTHLSQTHSQYKNNPSQRLAG